jgi:hypothetical protein
VFLEHNLFCKAGGGLFQGRKRLLKLFDVARLFSECVDASVRSIKSWGFVSRTIVDGMGCIL